MTWQKGLTGDGGTDRRDRDKVRNKKNDKTRLQDQSKVGTKWLRADVPGPPKKKRGKKEASHHLQKLPVSGKFSEL